MGQVGWRAVMVLLSDVSLVVLIACFVYFAIDMRRVARRDGLAVRRFAEFSIALAFFFGWFALVYFDRRFDIVPGVDLVKAMGYEWYWPFRLLLIVTVTRLWWALRPSPVQTSAEAGR